MKKRYLSMERIIRLWDDFASECRLRNIIPDYKLFSLWMNALSEQERNRRAGGHPNPHGGMPPGPPAGLC